MDVKKPLIAGLFAVCLIPAIIINTPIAYVPLAFLVILSLISVLYTLASACFFRLAAEAPGLRRYERETESSCKITVTNRGPFLLPHITLELCVESQQGFPPVVSERRIMLRPLAQLELNLPVRFPHIGRYVIKVGRVHFHGLLGVFSFSIRPRWSSPVHVTPKLFSMHSLSINTSRAAFAVDFSAPRKISGGEYSDVRQYSAGDPIKNIHWKLSAHTAEYITRLFRTDAVSGVAIYLDLCYPMQLKPEDMANVNDCTVESAYSLAAHALERGYIVNLIYSHSNSPAIAVPRRFDELTLAAYSMPPVSLSERYPIELLVSENSNHMAALDNIIVLTPTVSDRLIGVLASCKQLGKFPVLYHILPDASTPFADSELAERISGKGIEYRAIDSARALVLALEEAS